MMEEILVSAIKDLPFAVILLMVFYFLSRDIIKSAAQGQESSDALTTQVISLLSKFSNSIDSLKASIDAREQLISQQQEMLKKQQQMLRDEQELLSKLADKIDRLIDKNGLK